MTKIVLVRHGHVEGIKPERFRGRLELALTAKGRKEAEATALYIRERWQPEAVYTSPMGRAVDTGRAIAALFDLAVQPVMGLHDIDYGEWQGLTPDEVWARWPTEVENWYRSPHLAQIPGGETLQEVLARASRFIGELLRRHPDATVALVGHDSVNRIILLHALDLGLSHYWSLKQDPCAVSELDFSDHRFAAHSVNGTDHLNALASDGN